MPRLLLSLFLLLCFSFCWGQESSPDRWMMSGSVGGFFSSPEDQVWSVFDGNELGRWNEQFWSLRLAPVAYHRISNNWWLGMEIGGQLSKHSFEEVRLISTTWSPPVYSLDTVAFSQTTWAGNINFLARYQVEVGDRVAFFLEPFLGFQFEQSEEELRSQIPSAETMRTLQSWRVGIGARPGISVKVTQRMWLVGRFGLGLIQSGQDRSQVEAPWSAPAFEAELSLNLPTTQIGVEYRW